VDQARDHPDPDWRGPIQANVPPRLADLPFRFWLMIGLTGIGAGLGAILMMAALRAIQHLALSYRSGEYSQHALSHGPGRLLLVLLAGGIITGVGLWLIRRYAGGTGGEPTEVVWERSGDLSLARTLITGLLSEASVALGCSIGREAAPQRTGAAAGAFFGRRFALPIEQRRLLIACGAGAGLAAVYNVPFAGALFALEIYLGTITLSLVLPALATSAIATVVAWLALPSHTVYRIPSLPNPTLSVLVFAVLAGPLLGGGSALYVRMISWASDRRPKGRLLLIQPVLAFTLLGLVALKFPLLLGNGVDLAQFAFTGSATLLVVLALTVLKPVMTALCLRSGATGGLFTPTFSFGAIAGVLLGHLWVIIWPGAWNATYPLIGAAALLVAAIEAPATGVAMAIELTHSLTATAPILLAAVGATIVARRLELRSIYSARLPATPPGPAEPPPDRPC
jgi:CIC family chloride channel protein